jgi:cell fate regulator YaaT (PSP1 superfamily)
MGEQHPETLVHIVRHGAMRRLGGFDAGGLDPPPARGDRVIVRTDRGHEVGDVLAAATPATLATLPDPSHGTIVRRMTPQDVTRQHHISTTLRDDDYHLAVNLFAQHHLPMTLADVERLFGGEKIVFYFLAEGRVDFRELVRTMAREFQCRIELRQIGPRDEAKLLADYGDCGRPVCCSSFLMVLPAVSMRMAKVQKAGLDPNKLTGRCGRLKCCLRYEQDVYDEHAGQLPAIGARVVTAAGSGKVIAQELLAKRVLVHFDDGRRLPVRADELLS